jgi:parvulin-like peptidyl-prolyl isomerase
MNKRIAVLFSAGIGILAVLQPTWAADTAPAASPDSAPAAAPEPLYATVNGSAITAREFHAVYANFLRQKYYHGQVPEGQLAVAKQEVTDQMIDRILLLADARQRGLVPNEKNVAETIAGYETRYAGSEQWQKNRESLLPGLKQQLSEQDLLSQMEAVGRAIPEPTEDAVLAFYKAKPDLFTEPEKMRIHTILLKVDPSATKAQWDAARAEAADIVARLRAGKAEFEDLARLHSHDRSADDGGDMGYIHRGMIPESVQTRLDALQLGVVGDPMDVLEGVAVFRLDERVPGKLMPYEAVATRARELFVREQTDAAWRGFIAKLRAGADIKMVENPPPAKSAEK